MNRVRRWLPLAAFALVLGIVAIALWSPADRTVRSRLVGQPVPRVTLPPAVAGKPGIVPAATGEPYILNVFASWCVPCIAEAPQLLALAQAGVPIDAVAVRDRPQDVAAFLKDHGDPYRAIGNDVQGRVQLELGSSGVPESFVIGRDGRILLQHVGDIRADDVPTLRAAVEAAR